MREFKIEVPQARLDAIRHRITAFPWQAMPDAGKWKTGASVFFHARSRTAGASGSIGAHGTPSKNGPPIAKPCEVALMSFGARPRPITTALHHVRRRISCIPGVAAMASAHGLPDMMVEKKWSLALDRNAPVVEFVDRLLPSITAL
ncbi:hypothetical protein [Agrobacterium sp. P15N1-A]|uniref:hypothetical protein n=1 Tax=Agrobacterium sp. P15N1-A TaxID=3342820 RepID=UPI0037CEE8F0